MSALWRFLSGEVPGGFASFLVAVIAALLVLEYVFRIGKTLKGASYRRWRWRLPLVLLLIYFLWWIQAPPKREPLRVAVLCSEQDMANRWDCRGLADLTARRLRHSLSHALVNPWEGATNYAPAAAEALERANYRVYRLNGDAPQTGRGLHYTLANAQGAQQSFSATSPALLELSAQFSAWILRDLHKKGPLSAPFSKEPPPAVLESYYRAQLKLSTGEIEPAQAQALGALGLDSAFVPARILLARIFETKGMQAEAQDALLAAARSERGSMEALLTLGEYNLRRYDWEGAEAALKVVLNNDPLESRAAAGLASIHPQRLKDLRLNSPQKLLTEALRLDPAYELARISLADLLADRGLPEAARKLLAKGLQINPSSQDLLLKSGAVELQLGHPDAARQVYESLLKQDPLNAIAIFNLGVVDYRTRQYDSAIARFEEVQGLNGPVDCYYYLGIIYKIKGDDSRAKFFLQKRWEMRWGEKDAFGLKAKELLAELEGKSGGPVR